MKMMKMVGLNPNGVFFAAKTATRNSIYTTAAIEHIISPEALEIAKVAETAEVSSCSFFAIKQQQTVELNRNNSTNTSCNFLCCKNSNQ